jgi:hypothetical protein
VPSRRSRPSDVEALILEVEVAGDPEPDVIADRAGATEAEYCFPLGFEEFAAQVLVVL